MVEHIDRVDPELKFFGFPNPNPLDQVDVEPKECRAFDPAQAKVTNLSWGRIHQYDSARTHSVRTRTNRLVYQCSIESLQRCHGGSCRIRHRRQARNVGHAVRRLDYLSNGLGKVCSNGWCVKWNSGWTTDEILPDRGDRRRDVERPSRNTVEDCTELPTLDRPLDPSRAVGKELPSRAERQLVRTVCREAMRAMVAEQGFIDRRVGGIAGVDEIV